MYVCTCMYAHIFMHAHTHIHKGNKGQTYRLHCVMHPYSCLTSSSS